MEHNLPWSKSKTNDILDSEGRKIFLHEKFATAYGGGDASKHVKLMEDRADYAIEACNNYQSLLAENKAQKDRIVELLNYSDSLKNALQIAIDELFDLLEKEGHLSTREAIEEIKAILKEEDNNG